MTAALTTGLVDAVDSADLRELLEEHVRDNGQVLSHLFFGDLVRWLEASASQDERQAVVAFLESALIDPIPFVEELILVSFLENLSDDSVMWSLLGPRIRRLAAS